jgi:hypothetical protein
MSVVSVLGYLPNGLFSRSLHFSGPCLVSIRASWSGRWGETTSLNCSHQCAYCSFPRWYMNMVEWYRQGKIPDSSSRAVWQSYQQSRLVAKQEGFGEENYAFSLQSIFVNASKGSLTCRKILQHRADVFTSHPKESVLLILIALKNPSPLPGLNPRTLGPMTITLNITPPRRLRIRA